MGYFQFSSKDYKHVHWQTSRVSADRKRCRNLNTGGNLAIKRPVLTALSYPDLIPLPRRPAYKQWRLRVPLQEKQNQLEKVRTAEGGCNLPKYYHLEMFHFSLLYHNWRLIWISVY